MQVHCKIVSAAILPEMVTKRIEERKLRDREARREQIIRAAREIAELEGWSGVTVRRLSDEISYSQPVLYSHFANRQGIVTAVALAGFQELGTALEEARLRGKRGGSVEAVASAYLGFAAGSPALYEAMFSLTLSVPFGSTTTTPELQFAFSQVLELFSEQSERSGTVAELFWANLHGVAELTRTGRFPPKQQKARLRVLVEIFSLNASSLTLGSKSL